MLKPFTSGSPITGSIRIRSETSRSGISRLWAWVRTEGIETLAVGLLAGMAAWGSMILNGPLHYAIFWPANGILLGFLLTSPRKRWAGFLAAGFLASTLVHVGFRYDIRTDVVMSCANTIEILLAAWPFYVAKDLPPDLSRPASLWRFTWCSLATPVFSGFFVVTLLRSHHPEMGTFSFFRGWYAGDALGLTLTTPLMLAMLRKEWLALFRWKKLPETILMLAALTAPNLLLTDPKRFPLLFLDFPLLVLAVFRLGLPGATIGVVLMTIPITHYAVNNEGIFALQIYPNNAPRILILQGYFFLQLLMVNLTSSVLAERKRLEQALRSSEERFRGMAEHSWDIIVRTNTNGFREYVSPSVYETTGWSAEELIGSHFRQQVHPEDQNKVEDLLRGLIEGEHKQILQFRMERKTGGFLWLEAKARAVKDPATGELREFVAVIRDVSARVQSDEKMQEAYTRAETLALTDGLTNLGNRRSFDEMLEITWNQTAEKGTPLSLLMIDADHFKAYNDTHGHQAGDRCLRKIAEIIGGCIRQKGDFAARYGGEEFAVILPGAPSVPSQNIAERIRDIIANTQIQTSETEPELDFRITVSVGVATATAGEGMTARDLLHAADMALYAAKQGGRDCVRVHTPAPGTTNILDANHILEVSK